MARQRTILGNTKHISLLESIHVPMMVMIGDSHIERLVWHDAGKIALKRVQRASKYRVFCAGVGGDTVQDVGYRLNNGLVDAMFDVRKIIYWAGSNNFNKLDQTVDLVVHEIASAITTITTKFPHAMVFVLGFPRTNYLQAALDDTLKSTFGERFVSVVEHSRTFCTARNVREDDLFFTGRGADTGHFNELGYEMVGDILERLAAV